MSKRTIFFAIAFSFIFVAAGWAQAASASVDYVAQNLTAWGLAGTPWEKTVSLEEERSRAWMDAIHHAFEAILEIPLMSGVTIRNSVHSNPALKERLGHLLLSAEKTFYQPDLFGLVRCKVTIPFFGRASLRTSLYLAALRPHEIEPVGFGASGTFALERGSETGSGTPGLEYRRLVIDLRKTPFEPSLFPRFYSEDGRLIFQEGQVPGPFRFSRPVVKFTDRIEEVETGLKVSQVMYVAATVPLLSPSDVKILSPDAEIFYRVCRKLEGDPSEQREILIVFGQNTHAGGLLPKPQAKPTEKEKAPKPQKGKTRGKRR